MATEGFTGMADLIADLGRMGEDVQREAAGVVRSTAELMQAEVVRDYDEADGDLRRGVVVEPGRGVSADLALRWKVRSKAPHAHLYEFGTVQRFTAGTGANRGTMPAAPTFVPAAVRARARMVDRLTALLRRQRVKGMTGTMEVRPS
ncbi:MAG: HK97 gp10 family phage protein [Vicinamibacterales bacterium]